MSSAYNHKRRSRRGHYMSAPFSGGKRMSISAPTMNRSMFHRLISKIRGLLGMKPAAPERSRHGTPENSV